ncbi:MAG: (d)CMP kinase [Candidatus Loosdrechtia sp.]|uniref:(d)CMP kinase n=1 Tax=Candidatus Loosdrechtia sp. TaxID=3101272 RepID=UPI003A72D846|nr:MAG: (d)CMP kinase [Candidatus Jettenia sp. AMX2]
MIVAIDGPAGSGKSTLARMLSNRLGFKYLDTGAMYRALTWKAMQEGVNLNDEAALCRLMDDTDIEIQYRNGNLVVFVDEADVTGDIRSPSVTRNIHYISNVAGVRQRMVKLQQKLGAEGNIVAEGRDMTTVVFPHAEKKFFLDADVKERAKRRYKEFESSNKKISYEDVASDIEMRDRHDTTRNNSPLIREKDAIYINTTNLDIEEVFNKVLKEVESVVKNR